VPTFVVFIGVVAVACGAELELPPHAARTEDKSVAVSKQPGLENRIGNLLFLM
jgi:hypothetical protein